MKTNVKVRNKRRTHQGSVASQINKEQELRRSVMSCLLWEDEFYESGESIAGRIATLVGQVSPECFVFQVPEPLAKLTRTSEVATRESDS